MSFCDLGQDQSSRDGTAASPEELQHLFVTWGLQGTDDSGWRTHPIPLAPWHDPSSERLGVREDLDADPWGASVRYARELKRAGLSGTMCPCMGQKLRFTTKLPERMEAGATP